MQDNDAPEGPGQSRKSAGEEMAERLDRNSDVETAIFEGVRGHDDKPVQPVRYTTTDSFKFRCHKGVSCWNVCCHGADVTLTPMDILTLAGHFNMRPGEFVGHYTVPALHPGSGLPVCKLVMSGKEGDGPCVFMDEDTGCTVYDSRPVTCRYYPLGLGAVKMKGHKERQDMYFMVKESHCKGHAEETEQTVGEFREDQGVEEYDQINAGWIDILMKMASWRSIGGPMGRDVSQQTKKMFYMVSSDIDAFRKFVFETKFLATYEIDDELLEAIKTDDLALLQLGLGWLRNIMFNEPTIAMKRDVLQGAMSAARHDYGAT